jgi:hypothetical protein
MATVVAGVAVHDHRAIAGDRKLPRDNQYRHHGSKPRSISPSIQPGIP